MASTTVSPFASPSASMASSSGSDGVSGGDMSSLPMMSNGMSSLGIHQAASSDGMSGMDSWMSQEGVALGADGLPYNHGWAHWRQWLHDIVQSGIFSTFILTLIFLNTIMIAIQTSQTIQIKAGWYFDVIDNVFLGIYVFETAGKILVWRGAFVKNGWNMFDAFIVVTSFLEYVQFAIASASVINPKIFRLLRVFRAIRALRALRVLRTISFLASLQVIVSTLLSSIPALSSVAMLLGLVMYIFAIIGRQLYGEIYPQRFGNLGAALFALFQLITLDDWVEYYDRIGPHNDTILVYLIVYILLATFILINLFIAVIVSSLEDTQKKQKKRNKRDIRKMKKEKAIQMALEQGIDEDLAQLRKSKSGALFGAAGSPESQSFGQGRLYDSNDIPSWYMGSHLGDTIQNTSTRYKDLFGYYFMCMASLDDVQSSLNRNNALLAALTDMCMQEVGGYSDDEGDGLDNMFKGDM